VTSWVIVNKDGKAVFETYNRDKAEQAKDAGYTVYPIIEWLQSLNNKEKQK